MHIGQIPPGHGEAGSKRVFQQISLLDGLKCQINNLLDQISKASILSTLTMQCSIIHIW